MVYQKYCAVNAAGHLAERLVVNCFVYIQLLDARVLSSNLSALRSLELKWIAVLGGDYRRGNSIPEAAAYSYSRKRKTDQAKNTQTEFVLPNTTYFRAP